MELVLSLSLLGRAALGDSMEPGALVRPSSAPGGRARSPTGQTQRGARRDVTWAPGEKMC